MFEPKNAFEFAGYFLTDLVSKLETKEEAPKVSCYGGTAEDVQKFGQLFRGASFEEGVELFINKIPNGVTFACSMLFGAETQELPEHVLIDIFDYVEGTRVALMLPFHRRKRFQQLKIGDLETIEVWGPHSSNEIFREIAVFSTLVGCVAYPNASVIWAGKYEPDSKIASVFKNRTS